MIAEIHNEIVADAAGRIGEFDAFGTQISAMLIMLRALYIAHPEPARLRHHFDRLLAEHLDSPFLREDPDRSVVLQSTADALTRVPRAPRRMPG